MRLRVRSLLSSPLFSNLSYLILNSTICFQYAPKSSVLCELRLSSQHLSWSQWESLSISKAVIPKAELIANPRYGLEMGATTMETGTHEANF